LIPPFLPYNPLIGWTDFYATLGSRCRATADTFCRIGCAGYPTFRGGAALSVWAFTRSLPSHSTTSATPARTYTLVAAARCARPFNTRAAPYIPRIDTGLSCNGASPKAAGLPLFPRRTVTPLPPLAPSLVDRLWRAFSHGNSHLLPLLPCIPFPYPPLPSLTSKASCLVACSLTRALNVATRVCVTWHSAFRATPLTLACSCRVNNQCAPPPLYKQRYLLPPTPNNNIIACSDLPHHRIWQQTDDANDNIRRYRHDLTTTYRRERHDNSAQWFDNANMRAALTCLLPTAYRRALFFSRNTCGCQRTPNIAAAYLASLTRTACLSTMRPPACQRLPFSPPPLPTCYPVPLYRSPAYYFWPYAALPLYMPHRRLATPCLLPAYAHTPSHYTTAATFTRCLLPAYRAFLNLLLFSPTYLPRAAARRALTAHHCLPTACHAIRCCVHHHCRRALSLRRR